jgi:hypothetical protein
MDQNADKSELDLLPPEARCTYSKPGYDCVWSRDSLDDKFCRVDRSFFIDKTTGRSFQISEIRNITLRWVEIPGGIFTSRRAGYQIAAEYGGQRVVLLDTTDKMPRKYNTLDAQAICSGEKNILKVAIASILSAQTAGDIRRTYYEVFDRYGSDVFDTFPWPEGIL